MKLEVLHVADCPNLVTLLDRIGEVTDLPVVTHQIDSDDEATARGMAGSPTLLVDGIDAFAAPDQGECGVSCRIYRDEDGQMTAAPSVQQLREALGAPGPAEVPSSWRTRALPLDPVERAVHQAILRVFATTGRAPAPAELEEVTAGYGDSAEAVLQGLHECDAIRLGLDGRIAVAYPFSATPTRHRVRIGGRVDVYAMCAIDALGMSAMLGQDTAISSVDFTTGQPVTVVTSGERTVWEPASAVVFMGATAGGGPSADCCCEYLNFFTDTAAAETWTTSHPQVRGQILSQTEAEQLGTRLFGQLLAD
jgi:hypothetical protein